MHHLRYKLALLVLVSLLCSGIPQKTFAQFYNGSRPGAPIMHSRDLVHWRLVDYVYDCLEDDDVYHLRNGANAYGKGQWATSLRYENGRFWALWQWRSSWRHWN